jgi:hypothetical protein
MYAIYDMSATYMLMDTYQLILFRPIYDVLTKFLLCRSTKGFACCADSRVLHEAQYCRIETVKISELLM